MRHVGDGIDEAIPGDCNAYVVLLHQHLAGQIAQAAFYKAMARLTAGEFGAGKWEDEAGPEAMSAKELEALDDAKRTKHLWERRKRLRAEHQNRDMLRTLETLWALLAIEPDEALRARIEAKAEAHAAGIVARWQDNRAAHTRTGCRVRDCAWCEWRANLGAKTHEQG